MAKPDPLQLAHGHLCIAGRAALDFHRALVLARNAREPAAIQGLVIDALILRQADIMKALANEIDLLPEFFRGNLPASLRAAAKAWTSSTTA